MMDGNIKVPFGGKTLNDTNNPGIFKVDKLVLEPEMMSLILPSDIEFVLKEIIYLNSAKCRGSISKMSEFLTH